MKVIRKLDRMQNDNKGETIVEVVVAFAVLSIMMVMFAQGISYASHAGVAAEKKRSDADQALVRLQDKLAANEDEGKVPIAGGNLSSPIIVYRQVCEITLDDGSSYKYVVYTSD